MSDRELSGDFNAPTVLMLEYSLAELTFGAILTMDGCFGPAEPWENRPCFLSLLFPFILVDYVHRK